MRGCRDIKRGRTPRGTTMSSARFHNQPLQNSRESSLRSTAVSLLHWWYSFSAPPEVSESTNFTAREQARRGRVASLIILGTLCVALLLVPIITLAFPVPFN